MGPDCEIYPLEKKTSCKIDYEMLPLRESEPQLVVDDCTIDRVMEIDLNDGAMSDSDRAELVLDFEL